jgi:hypothetical protein
MYKYADLNKLTSLIHEYNWQSIIIHKYPLDLATEKVSEQFLFLVQECIPEKKVTICPNDKPWFDSMLRKKIVLETDCDKKL